MCKALDDIYKDGVRDGEMHGDTLRIISQVCRKIAKNKSLEVIADELEEDTETIKPIYDIAVISLPDCSYEEIYQKLINA